MYPVLFELGPLQIRFYGLMYVVAILTALFLLKKEVKRKGIGLTEEDVSTFILWAVIGGVIGARIYYVVFNWSFYAASPLEIPAVWHGGLAIHGGLIGGALGAFLFLKRHGVPFWRMADAVAPTLIIGQAFGRFGNFMNGDAHGEPTTMPWGIVFPPESMAGSDTISRYGENLPLHPTMLYEICTNVSIFLLLWFVFRKRGHSDGFIFALYLIFYSTVRFFIEHFRADSLMFGPLKTAQVISIVLIVVCLGAIVRGRLWKAA